MKLNFSESYELQYNTSFDDTPLGDVMGYLMVEGLVEDEAGAKSMIKAMSPEWFSQLIIEADEYKVKKLRRREMRKGEGLNNYAGKGGRGERKAAGKGDDHGRAEGGDGKAMAGKGRFANNTPWVGAGAGKRHQNNTKGDDARIKNYNRVARDDRRKAAEERRKERQG